MFRKLVPGECGAKITKNSSKCICSDSKSSSDGAPAERSNWFTFSRVTRSFAEKSDTRTIGFPARVQEREKSEGTASGRCGWRAGSHTHQRALREVQSLPAEAVAQELGVAVHSPRSGYIHKISGLGVGEPWWGARFPPAPSTLHPTPGTSGYRHTLVTPM